MRAEKKIYTKRKSYEGLNYALIPDGNEAFFRYLNEIFSQKNTWEETDTTSLVRLCQMNVLRDEIYDTVMSGEKMLDTGRGNESGRTGWVKNPLMATLSQLSADILAIEKELLLTPKARKARGQIKKEEKANQFEALAARKFTRIK